MEVDFALEAMFYLEVEVGVDLKHTFLFKETRATYLSKNHSSFLFFVLASLALVREATARIPHYFMNSLT